MIVEMPTLKKGAIMLKIPLNKYQKIGFVLSVIWIITVFLNTRNTGLERADLISKLAYQTCVDKQANLHISDLSSCQTKRGNSKRLFLDGNNYNAGMAALIPIPFLWLSAFILLHIGRGIKIGYQAVVPWSSFSLRKKIYASSCLYVKDST